MIFHLDLEVRSQKAPLRPSFSSITLADLAGSECLANSKTKGKNTREGGMINKSLLSLSTVIAKLSRKEDFVGFRESKLTRILQPMLTGNCITSIICTVNPLKHSLQESINTLKFGTCAGVVKKKIESREERDRLDSKLSKEALLELESASERMEQLIETVYERGQEIERLRAETEDLRSQMQLLETHKHLTETDCTRKASEYTRLLDENQKLVQMIEGMENRIIREKEKEFRFMFEQQTMLIRNLEDELEELKKDKQNSRAIAGAAHAKELIPCMRKPFGHLSNANSEPPEGLAQSSSAKDLNSSLFQELLPKNNQQIIYEKLKTEAEVYKEKVREAQKETLRLDKINHTLRLEIEDLRKQIKEADVFAELPRARKIVEPVSTFEQRIEPIPAFDRNGDKIEKKVVTSPTKEEMKRWNFQLKKRIGFYQARLDESQKREDFCRLRLTSREKDERSHLSA